MFEFQLGKTRKEIVNELRDAEPPEPAQIFYLRKDGNRGRYLRTQRTDLTFNVSGLSVDTIDKMRTNWRTKR